jgi:hypothetical protein
MRQSSAPNIRKHGMKGDNICELEVDRGIMTADRAPLSQREAWGPDWAINPRMSTHSVHQPPVLVTGYTHTAVQSVCSRSAQAAGGGAGGSCQRNGRGQRSHKGLIQLACLLHCTTTMTKTWVSSHLSASTMIVMEMICWGGDDRNQAGDDEDQLGLWR